MTMRAIGKLGEMVVGECDELRHAAAVIATVLGFSVRPRYWGRTARDLCARQVLAVGVEPVGFVCVMAVFVGISRDRLDQIIVHNVAREPRISPLYRDVLAVLPR